MLIALAWIDRCGRKPLLYAGLIRMTVWLIAMSPAFAVLNNHPTTGGGPRVTGIVTSAPWCRAQATGDLHDRPEDYAGAVRQRML